MLSGPEPIQPVSVSEKGKAFPIILVLVHSLQDCLSVKYRYEYGEFTLLRAGNLLCLIMIICLFELLKP